MARLSRRDQIVEAAVEVLVERGARGFTYRAVEEFAGVPPGTASNHFHNRDELLLGAVERMVRRMADFVASNVDGPPAVEEDLISALGAYVRAMTGPFYDQGKALLTLRYVAVTRRALMKPLTALTEPWLALLEQWLTALGSPDPRAAAYILDSYLSGLLIGQYVKPTPDFDPERSIAPVVWSALR